MTFLFFYSSLNLGGIETLIVRLSNWLVSQGHQVTIVLMRDGDLDNLLNASVRRIYIRSRIRAFLPWRGNVRLGELGGSFSAICAFDPESMCFAGALLSQKKLESKLFVGVYHPRAYFFLKNETLIQSVGTRIFLKSIPESSIVFMNESCRISHADALNFSFKNSHILPLALSPIDKRVGGASPYKIISVGRLVAFKTYNIYMISVINELINRGYKYTTWHVYGDGPLANEMHLLIKKYKLEKNIFLHGSIKYSELAETISDARVFVGMGTSLIEAGLLGIPGIIALDSQDGLTKGFTYDLEGFDVGEHNGKLPDRETSDLIEMIFNINSVEYETECKRTRKHCEKFLIPAVGADFLRLVPALATTHQFYDRGPLVYLWLNWFLVFLDVVVKKLHAGVVEVIKKILPVRLQNFPRQINHWWLNRRSSDELRADNNFVATKKGK